MRALRATRRGAKYIARRLQSMLMVATMSEQGLRSGRGAEVTGSKKHQAWLPMDHIEKLLKEACLNHAYPIKHILRDYSLMKSFMTFGSLSEAWKLMRSPSRATQRPFPEKTWS
jgi:enamine deaminase RidA (YjgF/YER057c/UK114 family)